MAKTPSKDDTAKKPHAAARPAPRSYSGDDDSALSRLNNLVVTALGPVQRDQLLSIEGVAGSEASRPSEAVLARARDRLTHQEARRQTALEAVLEQTLARLPANTRPGLIEPGWADRFFTMIADPEDEDRLSLWIELLTLKLTDPNAVPLATLRSFAELPSHALEQFRIFCRFVISNFVLRLESEFFDADGLEGDGILLLEEYGLLRTNRDLKKVFASQNNGRFLTNLLYLDKVLRLTHEDAGREFQFSCYRLTDAGIALARAVISRDSLTADTRYLLEVVRTAQKQGFKVAQADIIERDGEFTVRKHSAFFEIVAFNPR